MTKPVYLIINADDYGYSDGVSRGILQTVESGAVKAIGILANSPYFDKHTSWLKDYPYLDVGVHLTLTSGKPLCHIMSDHMQQTFGDKGFIPNKFRTVLAILLKKIPLQMIENEWDMQINRCVSRGINVLFINSHEHIHMLSPLFSLVQKLAKKYSIPNVRVASAEWIKPLTIGSVIRNTLLMGLEVQINRQKKINEPKLLGVGCSGNLNRKYMVKRFAGLLPERIYELMCHPGHYVPGEIVDADLLKYHNWESELNTLCDKRIIEEFQLNNIKLIGFRDLAALSSNSLQ